VAAMIADSICTNILLFVLPGICDARVAADGSTGPGSTELLYDSSRPIKILERLFAVVFGQPILELSLFSFHQLSP